MKLKLPNGFGSITKLTGKRRNPYMVRKTMGFTPDDKAIVKIIGYYPKYTDAMQALLEYNNNPALYDNKKYTFEMCYNAMCKEKYDDRGKDVPPLYRTVSKRCEPLFKIPIQDIRVQQLNNVIKSATTEATQAQIRTILNQTYKYAMRNEIVTKNPTENAFVPTATKSEKHQPFTDAELRELWQNTNDPNAKLWLIYIYTGLRPSELLRIENKNVHLDENYMIGGIKTDFSKNRMIPIADCIKPFIAELYDPNYKYLIHTIYEYDIEEKPMSPKGVLKRLRKYNTAHNINHLPHDSRHTTATMLNDQGVKLTTIQLILGQTPTSVAGKVYIHRTLVTMLDAVNSLPHY